MHARVEEESRLAHADEHVLRVCEEPRPGPHFKHHSGSVRYLGEQIECDSLRVRRAPPRRLCRERLVPAVGYGEETQCDVALVYSGLQCERYLRMSAESARWHQL